MSIPVLTIYNCGTNFHRASGDTVANLYARTLSNQAFITDGVGSGTFTPNFIGGRANPGGATKLGGLIFGYGIDSNIQSALSEIRRLKPQKVNMCGWSRGGVTCTKISSAMFRDPELRRIPVSIFAIDPVPGSTGPAGDHVWRQIELTRNVRNYYVVFAQHDSRAPFAPTYPDIGGTTNVTVEIMPGDHSAIAMEKGKLPDAARVVYDLAKRFLQQHGTGFASRDLLTASELINRYAKVQIDFLQYRAKAKADPGWLRKKLGTGTATRTIKDDSGTVVGQMRVERVGFFVNEHHRDLFQAKYFYLTQELDRDAGTAFRTGNPNSGWAHEAGKLSDNEPAAFEQLGYYIDTLFRGVGGASRAT